MFKNLLRIVVVIGLGVAGGAVFVCAPASGADFPKKPVRIIVTAGVGGGEDGEMRGLMPFLQKHLGVNIMVENIGGAGGKIALEKIQKTEPDGYTLLFSTFPKPIIIEYMEKVSYRTKDFTPVYAWTRSNQLLVGHVDNWKTFDEFLKAAKAKTLIGGFTGRGSTTHVAGLLAVDALGIKVNWVPYEGSGETLGALAGKHIDFVVNLASTSLPLIEGGRLRPLILFSDERDPFFPDVPVPKDLGFAVPALPGVRGIVAPPKTPAAIVKVLEEATSKAVKEASFVDWAKKRKMVIKPLNPQEFGKNIVESYPKVEKIQQMLKD
jgi:tripartite-type tricarboxylate transporter receptor subunit TctC